MIKNNYFYLITFIYAISLWSCSSEQMEEVETPVTFSICLDNDKTHSRAISDGTSVDQLMYAVYTTDGVPVIQKQTMNNAGKIGTEEGLDLIVTVRKGLEYKLVCWAQNSQCNAYTVSDDMQKVAIDYQGANNDELRDAFFGISEPFSANDKKLEVKLKRPFAQVNVGAHPFEWKYVKEHHQFNITQSGIAIKGIANVLNLLDGTVSGTVDVNFDPAPLPADRLYIDVDENGADEEYIYVSMSYVLASDTETEHDVDVFFCNESGQMVMLNKRQEQDPEETKEGHTGKIKIQRNRQSNIVGQVLTSSGELEIIQSPEGSNETTN